MAPPHFQGSVGGGTSCAQRTSWIWVKKPSRLGFLQNHPPTVRDHRLPPKLLPVRVEGYALNSHLKKKAVDEPQGFVTWMILCQPLALMRASSGPSSTAGPSGSLQRASKASRASRPSRKPFPHKFAAVRARTRPLDVGASL